MSRKGVEKRGFSACGGQKRDHVTITSNICHVAVMSAVEYDLQVAMCIVCRHDGHCDEATPDERAPFRVWSLLFYAVLSVMAGHSRLKDGVLSHANVPAIHVLTKARSARRGCHRKSGLPDFRTK
jgi:hypothetical protein